MLDLRHYDARYVRFAFAGRNLIVNLRTKKRQVSVSYYLTLTQRILA